MSKKLPAVRDAEIPASKVPTQISRALEAELRRMARKSYYRRQPVRKTPPVSLAIVELGRRFGALKVYDKLLVGLRYRRNARRILARGPSGRRSELWIVPVAAMTPEHLPGAVLHLLEKFARSRAVRLPVLVEAFNRAVERGKFPEGLDFQLRLLPEQGSLDGSRSRFEP